jgi:hypothetical protein
MFLFQFDRLSLFCSKGCRLSFLLFLAVFLAAKSASTQTLPKLRPVDRPERNKGNGLLVHFGYGAAKPSADLAKRFGPHQNIGLGMDYITEKNLILGLDANFMFGTEVKEDPLGILRTPEGDIIGSDQTLADVVLRERGIYIGGRVGYLFGLMHPRSGILVTIGAGNLRHRIRIQDNNNSMTQINGDYKKGYDRLSGGLALTQFVGYQRIVRYSGLNWFAGVEAMQGFTKPLRSYDFSTMSVPKGNRKDMSFGFKIGLTLPFIGEETPEEIYY